MPTLNHTSTTVVPPVGTVDWAAAMRQSNAELARRMQADPSFRNAMVGTAAAWDALAYTPG